MFEVDPGEAVYAHAPAPATPTSPPCPITVISMPNIASAPNQLPDSVDEEIAALQKRNQLFELQQCRSQLMVQANLEQGAMRAIPGNSEYPVM